MKLISKKKDCFMPTPLHMEFNQLQSAVIFTWFVFKIMKVFSNGLNPGYVSR